MILKRTPQYDEIEFTYAAKDGRTLFIVAKAKVLASDHTGQLSLRDFHVEAFANVDEADVGNDVTGTLPRAELMLIECAAEDRLYEDFRRRLESAREGDA